MSENIENTETSEENSSELHKKKSFSNFFYIPHISLFTEGNPYTGSDNTFNFRIKPDGDRLLLFVWYGMNCFEKSETAAQYEAEKNEPGLSELAVHLDREFTEYGKKIASGELKGRRTYRSTDN